MTWRRIFIIRKTLRQKKILRFAGRVSKTKDPTIDRRISESSIKRIASEEPYGPPPPHASYCQSFSKGFTDLHNPPRCVYENNAAVLTFAGLCVYTTVPNVEHRLYSVQGGYKLRRML